MARESIKTKKQDIVDYWFSRVDEGGLSVDHAEAHERCWRCGCERELERCHIVPDSLGGADEPSNLVLLCRRCHLENPNIADPEVMWDWLKAYAVPFYDTFWGIQGSREYEFIYNKTVDAELRDILGEISSDEEVKKLQEECGQLLQQKFRETTYHYGHPYLNSATLAGVWRMVLKEIARARGLELTSWEYNKYGHLPWYNAAYNNDKSNPR